MSTETSTIQTAGGPSRTRNRSIALVVAVLAAVSVWLIADVAGAELTVEQNSGPQHVTVVSVIMMSAIAALLGWGLLALLERFTARAKAVWTGIALAVLVVSLVPASLVDTPTGTRVALVLMHLVVGATVIPGFRKDARSA